MARRPWGMLGSHDQIRKAFQTFDHNNDSFLNAGELRRALTTIGEKLTDQQLDEMMQDFPVDGDGMLKYEGGLKQDHYSTVFSWKGAGYHTICSLKN